MHPSKGLLFACFGLTFCIIYSFAETSMASLYILGSLGGSSDTAAYSVALFGLGNTVTLPLGKYLGKTYGIKSMLQVCLPLFTAMTFLASLSSSYPLFVIHRFLEGCSSGPIMILLNMLLTRLSTEEEKRNFIHNIVIVLIAGSILGASVGGTLAYFVNWQSIFYVDTLLIIFMSSLLFYQLRNFTQVKEYHPFDFLGYLYFLMTVMTFSLFLILGQELDWFRSPFLVCLSVLFLIFLPFFVIRSWTHPHPVIQLNLLKKKNIALGMFQVVFLFSAYFGMVQLLSLWLHLYVSYTIAWVSIVLGVMALSTISVILLAEHLLHRSNILFLFLAIILLAISCFYTSYFDVDINFGRIAFSRVLAGIGFALFLPPLLHLILSAVPPNQGVEGLVLFQVTRLISCSLGAAVYSTIWQRREVFFHERLGEGLTSFSPLTEAFNHKIAPLYLTQGQPKGILNLALQQQSESLALNDTFYAMGFVMLILFLALTCFYRAPATQTERT